MKKPIYGCCFLDQPLKKQAQPRPTFNFKHEKVFGHKQVIARYINTIDEINPLQLELVKQAESKMKLSAKIVMRAIFILSNFATIFGAEASDEEGCKELR